jgi:putative transposase
MIEAVEKLGQTAGVSQACRALSVPRSSLYRSRKPPEAPTTRPTPPRALSPEEKSTVRAILNSDQFCDEAPREVYATLLDQGEYYCHWRTMYRILKEHDEVRERRKQRRHPVSSKPELQATGQNQLWSWDLTQLRGPNRRYYYLYTIIDVFSRYVPGWMIANRESAQLAERLIARTCTKQGIKPEQLVLHADRGSAMRSKTVAQLLIKLGIAKSHSRPYTPTDNPFSEAQFKTMKYRPDYPETFVGMKDARCWARGFIHWYNHKHHHTGLALMTPATVHFGQEERVYQQRQQVLAAVYAAHPERFVRGKPTPLALPKVVWINKPKTQDEIQEVDLAYQRNGRCTDAADRFIQEGATEIVPQQEEREMPAEADLSPFPVFGQAYDTTAVRTEQLLAGVEQLEAAIAP